MKKHKYEPHPCEICKMSYVEWVPFGDNMVVCNKYQHKSTLNYGNVINALAYQYLHHYCVCTKCYPSKWKQLKFKVKRYFQLREDKKYHRDEI